MKKLVSLLEHFGIHLSKDNGWHIHFSPRFKISVMAGAVLMLIFTVSMMHYSETPNFCNSCHIMKPYYDAWNGSKHNKIACVKCHYPPSTLKTHMWQKFQALSQVVKYVTRTYSSKPYAEVEDAACLNNGCHSTRLLQGKVYDKEKNVKFDHTPHLTEKRRGRQLRCTSCHSQIMVGKHMEVTFDTCFLCHFKGMGFGKDLKPIGGCLACHDLPAQNFKIGNMTYNHKDFVTKQKVSCYNCHLDVVRGNGDARKDRCFTCHNQPEKLERFGDIPFIHENHVTKHHVACFHCHDEIKHGFLESKETPAAEAAPQGHPETGSLNCADCHSGKHAGQQEMFRGKAKGLGMPDMPSPMYLAKVACVGCHYKDSAPGTAEFSGTTEKASSGACVKCHGEKFNGVWEETRDELTKALAELQPKLEAAKDALAKAGLKGADQKEAAEKLASAEHQLRFVRYGRGEHNIYLASEALRLANRAMNEVGKKTGASLKDLSAQPLISGSYCATLCHGRVGVKVPPETVRPPASMGIAAIAGKTMPHKQHTEMMGCVSCHDIGAHKKVPLRKNVGKDTCSGCHS